QIARALAAAHEKGIVHRDLKPENLFVTRAGRAKILDFGLARVDRPELSGASLAEASTRLETDAGTVLGTVGYMAPEQVRGERADARSDLFAFGVVLHELLSGANPFRRESAIESLHAILREEPPPVGSSPSGAGSALGRVVARLLEKRPEARFQSARDLAFALDELAGASSAGASPAPPAQRRARRLAAAAAALALVVAAAFWLWRERPIAARGDGTGPVRSLAVLPFDDLDPAGGESYFSDGMTDALTTELARLPDLKVIARSSAAVYSRSHKPPREIARELGVEALVTGSVLRAEERVRISAQLAAAGDDRVLWAESYERAARDVLALQAEVARAVAGAIALELTPAEEKRLTARRVVDPRALDEYLRGRARWSLRTEPETRAALAHFEAATRLDPDFALAHVGVADAYIILAAYHWMEPRTAAPLARAAAERAIALDPTAGEPHASLGDLHHHFDLDFEAALRAHERALELSPSYAVAWSWRAEPLLALGRTEEALAALRRSVELDPLAAFPRFFLGQALRIAGRVTAAEVEFRRAIELSPEYVPPQQMLVRLALERGDTAMALVEARSLAERIQSPAGDVVLGLALVENGQSGEARELLARMESQSSVGESNAYSRAALAAALGERGKAIAALRQALENRDFRLPTLLYRRGDLEFQALSRDPEFESLLDEIRGRR
ncbi:MAG: protein kinase, partial [Thermoanaerobaculia bacterium]|nr:protein kinase [Thermoanaerobaculia bacterium]